MTQGSFNLPFNINIPGLDKIQILVDAVESWLNRDTRAVSARVRVPKYRSISTGEDLKMPFNVMNDVVTVFPVEFDNLAGTPVSPPAGGTVSVSLVDGSGAPSPLGTVALEPDGTSFAVTPTLPIGSSHGDATVKYDDMVSSGTPSDISFMFDITFTDDTSAARAHVDTAHVTTRPISP